MASPNNVSPILPPDTNLQALLVSFAAPWQITNIVPPLGHYVAGIFGSGGINTIPLGLNYTQVPLFETALASESPYQPILMEEQINAIMCGDGNAAYTNNLSGIHVPVFLLGAAGGVGSYGLYTLSLLGSQDVQSYIVSFYLPSQSALDYGHFDLFAADNAATVVWPQIAIWLRSHQDDVCF